MAKNEVVFLPVNCVRTHKTFYARYDFAFDKIWVLTYGVEKLPDQYSDQLKNATSEVDVLHSRTGPQYRCPFCGQNSFVHCGRCGGLTCYSGDGLFTCDHCGNTGKVEGRIDTLTGDKRHSQ